MSSGPPMKRMKQSLLSFVRPTTSHTEGLVVITSSYATWFTAGGAIRIAHCGVIDDVITRKL